MSTLAKVYPRVISTREIARREHIPLDYLEKILSALEKENLILPKRGIGGGYSLARPPQKIKLLKIFRVLEQNLTLLPCQLQKRPRTRKKNCPIKSVWQKLKEALERELNSITLDKLAR